LRLVLLSALGKAVMYADAPAAEIAASIEARCA
jgi:hypothetical protein